MLALFKKFDVDGTEEITVENLKEAMAKLGKHISTDEINEIMTIHDDSGDQKI